MCALHLVRNPERNTVFFIELLLNMAFIPFSRIKKCTPQERLTSLQDVKTKRLAQPHDSQLRMKDICDKIPLSISDIDVETPGYHNVCYQRFTKTMDRLVSSSESCEQQPSTRKYSPRKRSATDLLYPPNCVFCEKNPNPEKSQNRKVHHIPYVCWTIRPIKRTSVEEN